MQCHIERGEGQEVTRCVSEQSKHEQDKKKCLAPLQTYLGEMFFKKSTKEQSL